MLERFVQLAAAARCASLCIAVCCLAACGGAGTPISTSTDASTSASTVTSVNLTLSGTPAASAVPGSMYSFQPTASQTSETVVFSISGIPAWATFNSNTGRLSGSPTAADEGTTRAITITASDGGGTASIGPFAINVTAPAAPPPAAPPPAAPPPNTGTATLSWTAPKENTNGTPLTDLAGYTIQYGTNPGAMSHSIPVPSATTTSYEISNLAPGTYYFDVIAHATDGTEGPPSNVESKTI